MGWNDVPSADQLDQRSQTHLSNIQWALEECELSASAQTMYESFRDRLLRGVPLSEGQYNAAIGIWKEHVDWCTFEERPC
jgi:hypothetical protein